MTRKSRRESFELWENLAKLIVLLGFLTYAPLVGWWNGIPPGGRNFLIFTASIAIISGSGLIIVLIVYRKRERSRVWGLAMSGWQNDLHGRIIAQEQSAIHMSDIELEKFAAQVHRKMGYRAEHTGETGDHGVDVLLINPNNQKEIVQCKQWNRPVGESAVRDLYGAMMHEKAIRGWLWAPRGFSQAARVWANVKMIELIDDKAVGRLIELAFGNKT